MREAVREAEEDRLAKEAAEAEAAKRAEKECAAREQLSLLRNCRETSGKRRSSSSSSSNWKAEEQRFALETAREAEGKLFSTLPFSAGLSQSSEEAAALATVNNTEASLEEAFARVERLLS